jgi:hypothetical protein
MYPIAKENLLMPLIGSTVVTDRQAAVYDVLKQYGPIADHALVPLAQHQMQLKQSSSGIRTRRAELVDLGLVEEVGQTKTGSGRSAKIYGAL